MKLHEITESKITDEERQHLHQHLGGRPEKFKYTGPSATWLHWAEAEDFDEIMERWGELKQVEEFCVSTPGPAISALTGLVFEGKPRFYFPFDVSSTFDSKTGLRVIMSKDELQKFGSSTFARHLKNDVGESERKTHDEAWANPKEVKFVGIVISSYGKSIEQLMEPDGHGQLSSMMEVIEDVFKHNLRLFVIQNKKLEEVNPKMLPHMQQVVKQFHE